MSVGWKESGRIPHRSNCPRQDHRGIAASIPVPPLLLGTIHGKFPAQTARPANEQAKSIGFSDLDLLSSNFRQMTLVSCTAGFSESQSRVPLEDGDHRCFYSSLQCYAKSSHMPQMGSASGGKHRYLSSLDPP